MRKALYLRDPYVASVRATHPALKGARTLARGMFCVVFEASDPTRVLKLTTDKTHYAYLADYTAPEGKFKPEVLADHGVVGQTMDGLDLYLLEVERLQPLRRGTANNRLVRRLTRYVDSCHRFPDEEAAKPEDIEGLEQPLLDFMSGLNWMLDNYESCMPDCHAANFMERSDGTLVFSDPVFDQKTHTRLSRLAPRYC